ncbi:uncharacterized protein [Asterias amurensis]|uniref:uncharacterized protein isoform X1 n=1 Tax=Asterias amurensis TaxID=7602 RepID=UPI003AB55C75
MKTKMAGLNEVLRTFALQKMQELKEKQGTEDTTEDMINQSNKNGVQEETTENKETKGKPEDEAQINEQTDHTPSQETVESENKQMKPSEKESDINETETDAKVKEPNQKKADVTSKDSKDKKITIKLFTKTIETEVPKEKKEDAAEEKEEDDDDEGSSSDDSENEDETEMKDGKPWRKVYEEGELSPSSESDDEEGDGEIKSNKEDDKDSDSSGEIKDENTKKSKKHKKHKHKKHKHKEKVKDKESPKDKDKHKDKRKKEKKKDKDKKEHKDKNKKKSKSKDKEDAGDKEDGAEAVNLETEKKHKNDKKHKSKHKDKGDEKDEKSKSSSKRKHKSRSRSQSPSVYKSSSHKKRRHSSRSRSKSPRDHRHKSNSRERDYYGKRTYDIHYSNRDLKHRRRSRSRSPHKVDEFRIDKAKLLEIAKANAYAKMQSGEFPPYMKLTPKSTVTRVDKKEGRSVAELTAVCKEISSKQKDYSDSDDSPVNRPVGSDEENDEPFIRHPFKVREAPLGIVMNIKNAVQKPIQDKEMLRLTFPVSSGSQHRKKEDELGLNPYGDWIAVEKKPKMMDPVAKPTTKIIPLPGITTMTSAEATVAAVGATLTATETSMQPDVAAVVAPPAVAPDAAVAAAAMPPPLTTNVPTAVAAIPAAAIPAATPVVTAPVIPMPQAPLTFAGIIAGALPSTSAIAAASAIPAAAAAAEYAAVTAAAAVQRAAEVHVAAHAAQLPVPIGVAAVPPVQPKKVEPVFEEVPIQKVDIAAMVSARLKAARRLESNPNDVEALSVMHKAQTQIRNWTMCKQKPGMFTGDTGLRTLRPEQLANSDPRAQAWAKKDMFHNQTPLKGGVGAMLMAKMGWKQGEGLGKNNEGVLEPLALDVKTDRKGLVAEDEQRRKKNQVPKAIFKDLSGKHPVSALMEICNKRKWAPPSFDLVQDKGPAHKKSFIFKVRINNEEYQPSVSCPNKKQAKAQAAAAALQKMGLIPADSCVSL